MHRPVRAHANADHLVGAIRNSWPTWRTNRVNSFTPHATGNRTSRCQSVELYVKLNSMSSRRIRKRLAGFEERFEVRQDSWPAAGDAFEHTFVELIVRDGESH